MGIPPGQAELSTPTNLFSIKGEVFGYPLDGVGYTTVLGGTELSVKTTSKSSEPNASLSPRVRPPELLVVINSLTKCGRVLPRDCGAILVLRGAQKSDVDSSQADVNSHLRANFTGNVGLVLCAD